MKIIKEVIIKASLNDTWSCLTNDKILNTLIDSGNGAKSAKPHMGALNIVIAPPNKLTINGNSISPNILTSFELSERGHRTFLKLTISGWETLKLDAARIEMPQISLDWEKKLGALKKSIESAAIAPTKA